MLARHSYLLQRDTLPVMPSKEGEDRSARMVEFKTSRNSGDYIQKNQKPRMRRQQEL
jgi:hypothetical protein